MSTMEDPIYLKVKKSIIGQGGRARISKKIFDKLEVQDIGDLIVVEHNNNTILVEAYADVLVDEDYIRLRWNDLNRLQVLEEDTVTVKKYKPLSRKITKKVKKMIR